MHKEALGDFNQALATRGADWGPGQWPSQRRNGTSQGEGLGPLGQGAPCGEALISG